MRGDGSRYKWYTDCRDGLMLDMFWARFAEVRARCQEKTTTGEVYPCWFVVHPDSPIAWMYDFKAHERYSEKKEKLARDCDKSLQE